MADWPQEMKEKYGYKAVTKKLEQELAGKNKIQKKEYFEYFYPRICQYIRTQGEKLGETDKKAAFIMSVFQIHSS